MAALFSPSQDNSDQTVFSIELRCHAYIFSGVINVREKILSVQRNAKHLGHNSHDLFVNYSVVVIVKSC